jgi:hypothetical protein
MKFYPSDWRADPALRTCSIAARGLWIEMLCIMHEAEPYGSLLIKGKRIDKKQLASLCGILEKECVVLMLELEGFGVFERDLDGTIYSRRMRRDHAKAIRDKENGKGGGNPNVKGKDKGWVNPQDNREDKAQKPETIARSQKADARSDLEKRTGNFQQAVVRAFAVANSPNLPETSRCGLWLSQGYQEDICLAVITEIVRRRPSITTLNYFDNAIKEAHAAKAPPRQAVPMKPEEVNWDMVLTDYKKFGRWSKWAGPDLESPACRCPPEFLKKHGLAKQMEPIEIPSLSTIQ